MKKRIIKILSLFMLVCLSLFIFTSCLDSDYENNEEEGVSQPDYVLQEDELFVPNSASYYVGKNYKEVIAELQSAGFTNIKTEIEYDIYFGFLASEEEIENISINGNEKFKKYDVFRKDALIIVTYHDWYSNEPSEEDKSMMDENGIYAPISSNDAVGLTYEYVRNKFVNAGFTNVKYVPVTGYDRKEVIDSVLYVEINYTKEYKTNLKLKKDISVLIYRYIGTYTEENCDDLKELLNVKDPGSSIVSNFAYQYDGEYIEFDGCIRAIDKTSGYDTRYDVILGSKDFDENKAYGPNFKLECENLGSETYKVGQNVHVVARVKGYDADKELFKIYLEHIEKRTVNGNNQTQTNAFDIVKTKVVDSGEYNTLVENGYSYEIFRETNGEKTYVIYIYYDINSKNLQYMIFYKDFESEYYCSLYLEIGTQISENYNWLFIDSTSAEMIGTITPNIFTNNSTSLSCNYSNLEIWEQGDYMDLTVLLMKLLLTEMNGAFSDKNINVSISDFGFYNY